MSMYCDTGCCLNISIKLTLPHSLVGSSMPTGWGLCVLCIVCLSPVVHGYDREYFDYPRDFVRKWLVATRPTDYEYYSEVAGVVLAAYHKRHLPLALSVKLLTEPLRRHKRHHCRHIRMDEVVLVHGMRDTFSWRYAKIQARAWRRAIQGMPDSARGRTSPPTPEPTLVITAVPTMLPTPSPSTTLSPTTRPTATPTSSPTSAPTHQPTISTTPPTLAPTSDPTPTPTLVPTDAPTSPPTRISIKCVMFNSDYEYCYDGDTEEGTRPYSKLDCPRGSKRMCVPLDDYIQCACMTDPASWGWR